MLTAAHEVKKYLIKHKQSVADVKLLEEEIEEAKKIFAEVLGEKLVKRVTFIPVQKERT